MSDDETEATPTPSEEETEETEERPRRRPRLRRGAGASLPRPGRVFFANARAQSSAALWPHASRASLVLVGGGALIVAHIIWDPQHAALKAAPAAAFNRASVSDAQAGSGGQEAIGLLPQLGGVVGLALFASISEATGTLALLILAALWIGYLWLGTNSPLNKTKTAAPPAGNSLAEAVQQATAQIQQHQTKG